MFTINFRKFKFFTDITKQRTVDQDVAFEVADLIYKNSNGVLAHDVAFRIYESKGEIELSNEEVTFLKEFMKGGTPAFQDSFEANLSSHE